MADEPSAATKAITTAQLAMSVIGLVKSIGLAVLVLMVDYYRRQSAKSEKQLAVVETEVAIIKGTKEIDDAAKARGDAAVISDFLNGSGS